MYKGFDDAKDKRNSTLLQVQSQDQVSKSSKDNSLQSLVKKNG